MNNDYKEVYFGEYCTSCKWANKQETEEPCDTCLGYPVNSYSHKPVCYEPAKTKKGKGT